MKEIKNVNALNISDLSLNRVKADYHETRLRIFFGKSLQPLQMPRLYFFR